LNMEQCKDIKAKLGYTCYAAVVVWMLNYLHCNNPSNFILFA
jgi:hypothetical protein